MSDELLNGVKVLLALRKQERQSYLEAGIPGSFDGERSILDLEWLLKVYDDPKLRTWAQDIPPSDGKGGP